LSLGASYDPGDWFVVSEWIQRQSTTKVDAMYVSGGARIEKFTPFITYSTVSAASFFPSTPTATSILSSLRSQSTVSLGMRWDFMKKTDLKVQYDQVRLSSNSNGYLINIAPNAVLYGDRIDLISLAVDFVF
jgi:predicted porin